jgi:prevent-host-death family protein
MKTATISDAKNRLSSLLDRVKAGQTVLITDRGVPVARLESVSSSSDPTGRRERLARAGVVRLGSGAVPAEILAGPTTRLPGASLVEAVLEERRSGW